MNIRQKIVKPERSSSIAFLLAGVLLACCIPTEGSAQRRRAKKSPCILVADYALQSCRTDVTEENLLTVANCTNIADRQERKECKTEGRAVRREGREECSDIRIARRQLCRELQEETYSPSYMPTDFLTPAETEIDPNQYFPLVPGTVWTYKNADDGETITVTVTNDTRVIDGVTTIVVNDVVILDESGATIEDTDDYYAQHTNGDVWYFGEVAQEFEGGYLDSLDGSFIAGDSFAKPGILVKAAPQVGDIQRQEFALREAEDYTKVLSISASASTPGGSCTNTCLLTEDGSPLDPGVVENKYYAPGIGILLEVNPETGSRTELTSFVSP